MHWNVSFIILASLLSPFISAVDIEHYRTRTCEGNHLTCIGIQPYQCCNVGPNRQSSFSSALFRGLRRSATGNICRAIGSDNCGSVQRSVSGQNKCAELTNIQGSFWFNNWQQSWEDTNYILDNEAMGPRYQNITMDYRTVLPDLVNIEGHAFRLHRGTPLNVTVTLMEIFDNDGSYKDIPEEMRRWEIREETMYRGDMIYEYAYQDADEDADGDADGGADGGTE